MEPVKGAPPGTRASRPHKTWHDRGYLPHFDEAGTVQFLTFVVGEQKAWRQWSLSKGPPRDAVPAEIVAAWKT